ncbi:multicopper oxidase domain-containing protein [Paenibacillus typhae]|uniref:Multicopper oxidase with three cupredoxin domains (Includes cell division protein FtsP and spore coat protein CotA) n=1 Tax=Paenibacillus typhae TaxID=1174501 RepID=A0A1G8QP07_9BACL|nr:multicopper oxidase domain-containing protein [Paenibacillus typhae]SDJ05840.1 Multicopper oxidase with three cupredoxin domains (includes cell division protein FtsP and spore coat protein CotA) [Paenibacillus typhae]
MSNRSLVWLLFIALILGGTAAGLYMNGTSAVGQSSTGMAPQATDDMSSMDHSAHGTSTNVTEEETPVPSSTPTAIVPTPTSPVTPGPENTTAPSSEPTALEPKEGQPVKGFSLTAMNRTLTIAEGITLPLWTFNGTVPGQEIRVTQGDFVVVTLKNELEEPVSIHWHGYPVTSEADGVPGVTQEAVNPGETFTYRFSADIPGTYWYHSHQESSKQVDKGLYGALIVEPKSEPKPDQDVTLLLDEWMEEQETSSHSAHGSSSQAMSEEEMMATMYNIYTVNGKSGSLIDPLTTKVGDTVRLRLINAGYRSHAIHIPGEFKVVSSDGQDIAEPGVLNNQMVTVAPGERYDIEMTIKTKEDFTLDAHDNNLYNDQLVIPVKVAGSNGVTSKIQHENIPVFNLLQYGKQVNTDLRTVSSFAVEYTAILNSKMNGNEQQYTINDQVFKDLPSLQVKTGDYVKLTLQNDDTVDHPIHIHGHFAQVIERNGELVRGTIMKDTVLVKPGEKVVLVFKADNPGNWLIHCHELHHAAGGMVQKLIYTDYKSAYTPGSSEGNKPE